VAGMSRVCEPGQESVHWYVTALDQLWEIKPEDIKEQWMGVMTKRLLKELNRQIAAVESIKEDKEMKRPTPEERAHNAKILASLEQTLERLARLEKERVAIFEGRKGDTRESARSEILRKLDAQPAREKKAKTSQQT
jgi:hypothetical protein